MRVCWTANLPCDGVVADFSLHVNALDGKSHKAGVPWHSSAPLGNLWSRKFGAMSFWDTFYAADGMLRAGHIDEVRQFGRWLV